MALHAVVEFELRAHLEHFNLFGITKELKVGLITITITITDPTTCSAWVILRNGGSAPASHPAYRVLLHTQARLKNAHKYLHHASPTAADSGSGVCGGRVAVCVAGERAGHGVHLAG
jgi:hypothetical protein